MRYRLRLGGVLVVLVAALTWTGAASANVQMGGTAQANTTDTARWVTYPTCTATSSTVACTGRVVGIPRPNNNPLGTGLSRVVQAGLTVRVRYDCADSGVTIFSVFEDQVASVEIQNGQTFTISHSPDPFPGSLAAFFSCDGLGEYLRDPSYYEVSVDIGWGFGAPSGAVTILTGPIGTITPS
jgi:hypothetical protein